MFASAFTRCEWSLRCTYTTRTRMQKRKISFFYHFHCRGVCYFDTMLIKMHESRKVSDEGHFRHRSSPDQGEGRTVKAIASYIIPCSLRANTSVTRMHSSGMRTARLLTVSQHALHRRVSAQGGVCLPRGGAYPSMQCSRFPPVDRQTPVKRTAHCISKLQMKNRSSLSCSTLLSVNAP